MVTLRAGKSFIEGRSSRLFAASTGPAARIPTGRDLMSRTPGNSNSLILIEIKHIQNVAPVVDQQHATAVNHAFQIARQLGKLLLASQRQGLGFILNLRGQAAPSFHLPLRS